jgi:hypothetical protein
MPETHALLEEKQAQHVLCCMSQELARLRRLRRCKKSSANRGTAVVLLTWLHCRP